MLLHDNDGNNSGDGDDEAWLSGGLKDNDETVDIVDDDGLSFLLMMTVMIMSVC